MTTFTHAQMHLINASIAEYMVEHPEKLEAFMETIIEPLENENLNKLFNSDVDVLDAYAKDTIYVVNKDKERKADTSASDENVATLKNYILPLMKEKEMTKISARQLYELNVKGAYVTSVQKASAILKAGLKAGIFEKTYAEGQTAIYYSIVE